MSGINEARQVAGRTLYESMPPGTRSRVAWEMLTDAERESWCIRAVDAAHAYFAELATA